MAETEKSVEYRKEHSDSFLIEEYKHLCESFLSNEELGERRLNFFITLATAVIGGMTALSKGLNVNIKPITFSFGLAALFLFGFVTLMRIIRRNLITHEYLRSLGRIRRYFADKDPKILPYLPYPPFDDQPQRKRTLKKIRDIFPHKTGGLVEMVSLVNGVILGALFVLIAGSCQWWSMLIWGLFGFGLAWVGQLIYVKCRYENGKPGIKDIIFLQHTEAETTLVICSDKPDAFVKDFADLTSVANYQLLPQDTREIQDVYFDTPERDLEEKKFALRIREIGYALWITLKGPSKKASWGGVERFEIEELWSKEALEKMIKELHKNKIKNLRLPKEFSHHSRPRRVLEKLGMEAVQNRNTKRQVRNIVLSDNDKWPVLAELVIDSVTYHLKNREIRHHEIEIEAKMRDGKTAAKTVAENLIKNNSSVLKKWSPSKLATGKAIEKLFNEGAIEELIDSYNNLKPGAYDKINDYLKSNKK